MHLIFLLQTLKSCIRCFHRRYTTMTKITLHFDDRVTKNLNFVFITKIINTGEAV